ncbi:MAG: PAS domain S-box-containing protein, partial [Planctomycetota bacterium]
MHEDIMNSQGFQGFGDNLGFLRLLFDVSPSLVFVKDRQGRFVFANKALADVYGTDVQDLIGKSDADFDPELEEIEHFLTDDLHVMNSLEERFIAEERVTDP